MLEVTTCFGPAPNSQQYLCENKYDFHIALIKLMLIAPLFVKKRLLFVEKLQFENTNFFPWKALKIHISTNIRAI